MTVTAALKKKIIGPKLNFKNGVIDLNHGSGGRAMAQLIAQLFHHEFDNKWLAQQNDAASFHLNSGKFVMTTDAFVVSPLFFPGGNIGSLSIHGTLNDLAMLGAQPLYLTVSFILEEGLALFELQKIVRTMAEASRKANVAIITGDTKVVERGKGDGVFITTTGIGKVADDIHVAGDQAKPGDHVIVSGFVGDHGVAIMAHRNNLQFDTSIKSDTASLHNLVQSMIKASPNIHCLRDPTRGGLATTLNEIAKQSNVGFIIDENKVPIRTEVASACELLGLDTFYVANEGKLIAICPPNESEKLLMAMRQDIQGLDAQIIGEVVADPHNFVQLRTKLGGMRIMDWLVGEQLPRIC